MSEVKKQSAFKVWTQKHADLWQIIKFTLVSMIAGTSEMVLYNVFLWVLRGPLMNISVDWFIFHYPGGAEGTVLADGTIARGGACVLVAYLVSTIVGNFVSFVVNRKTTFKSVANVKFSIIATMVMIVFIIFYSTVLGGLANSWVGTWKIFENADGNFLLTFLMQNIGKFMITMITFVFVFLMNKFVILFLNILSILCFLSCGTHNQDSQAISEIREAEKREAEERAARPSKKVINKALANKFLIATVVLIVLAVAGIAIGLSASINAVLIIGSVLFGVGYIALIAFIIEKVGTKVPVEELGEFENKEGYIIK